MGQTTTIREPKSAFFVVTLSTSPPPPRIDHPIPRRTCRSVTPIFRTRYKKREGRICIRGVSLLIRAGLADDRSLDKHFQFPNLDAESRKEQASRSLLCIYH